MRSGLAWLCLFTASVVGLFLALAPAPDPASFSRPVMRPPAPAQRAQRDLEKATAPRAELPAAPAPPRVRVVLDPGHGGDDEGGRGRHTTDRDISTAVAARLKVALAADPRFEVVLTRDDNRKVSLDARVALARKVRADAFISMHANVWHRGKGPSGVEVSHASAPAARAELARVFRKIGAHVHPRPVHEAVGFSLFAHEVLATQARSMTLARDLAGRLHDSIVRRTGQRGRGVSQKNWRVIKPYEFPAVLVELGYLTNPAEEALMMTPAWQENAAGGIHEGLVQWLAGPRVMASL